MSFSALIVGAGGAGKGVLNLIKERLLLQFKTTAEARVRLLAIDGPLPQNDANYLPPSGVSISDAAADREFYQLSENPRPLLQARAQGVAFSNPAYPFVCDRLSQVVAGDLVTKITNFAPATGLGGCRPVSHTNFCLEAPALSRELDQALTEVRRYAEGLQMVPTPKPSVFLVGSQVGGTGSGQLSDIALLLRSKLLQGEFLHLVLLLPDCFDAVIRDPSDKKYAYAKGFNGLRELARLRKSNGLAQNLSWNANVQAPIQVAFDICYLIDGKSAGLDLTTQPPIQGAIPATADFIVTQILDNQHIQPQVVNWLATSLLQAHYSSMNSHIWHVPVRRLESLYSLKFAYNILQRILVVDSQARANADQRLGRLMGSTRFTEMALDLSHHSVLPLTPDQWRVLLPRLHPRTTPSIWPTSSGHDVLFLPKEIKTSYFIFGGPSNEEVKAEADGRLQEFIGASSDRTEMTISGWLNLNNDSVRRDFAAALVDTVRDLFYRQNSTGQLVPRPLGECPNTIVEAELFLRQARANLSSLLDGLKLDYERNRFTTDPDNPGVSIPLSTLRRRDIDQLPPPPGKDKTWRARYLEVSQNYFEVRIWEILTEGAIDLAKDLLAMAEVGWGWVGDQASGWKTYLEVRCLGAVTRAESDLRTNCRLEDQVRCRTAVPMAGSPAETYLYDELAAQGQLEQSALNHMSWVLLEDLGSGTDPLERLKRKALFIEHDLRTQQVPFSETRVLQDVMTIGLRACQVSSFQPEILEDFAREHLHADLDNITIWDALYADYAHEWLPRRHPGSTPSIATVQTFAEEMVNQLVQKSVSMLAGAPVANMPTFCLSSFRGDAETLVGELAGALRSQLEHAFGAVHSLPGLTKEVRVVRFKHGFDYTGWSSTTLAAAAYYENELAGHYPTAQVYPNESCAYRLERRISESLTHTPVPKPLAVEYTALMGKPEDFELCMLSLAEGLWDELDEPGLPGSGSVLGVLLPREVPLGAKGDLFSVVRSFLACEGPQSTNGETARKEIGRRWDSRVGALKTATDRGSFFKALRDKAHAVTYGAGWREIMEATVLLRASRYGVDL